MSVDTVTASRRLVGKARLFIRTARRLVTMARLFVRIARCFVRIARIVTTVRHFATVGRLGAVSDWQLGHRLQFLPEVRLTVDEQGDAGLVDSGDGDVRRQLRSVAGDVRHVVFSQHIHHLA